MTDAARSRRPRRAPTRVAVAVVLAAGVTSWPAAANAHGIGGRTDLPLPLWLVVWSAAAALVVSFAALALFWPRPRFEGDVDGTQLPGGLQRAARVLGPVVRAVGLVAFVIVLAAAAFGNRNPLYNVAPVAVYVVFWVGLTLASGAIGDVWAVLSPYDTLAALAQRVRRRGGTGAAMPREGAPAAYRLDAWPAVAGLFAFTWLELAYPRPDSPRALAVAIGIYSVLVLGGAARWGRGWLRHGEAFAAFFGLLARMAPLCRDDERRLRLRPPLAGLAAVRATPAITALVLVALGSTTFDGFTRTMLWTDLRGSRTGWGETLLATLGLVWVIALVTMLYVGAMRVAARLVDRPPMSLVDRFLHSLVPIALAYAVAHYFSLLVFEGQGAWALLSDPLGRDWDLFGTAAHSIDYRAVSPSTIAYVQAGAIVVGHVAGVVLAHDRAVALFPQKVATRSQLPLLAAMVAYTVGGLLLLLTG